MVLEGVGWEGHYLILIGIEFQTEEAEKLKARLSNSVRHLVISDGVKARAPKAKAIGIKAKAIVHKAKAHKAKDKVKNRDQAYVKAMTNQHNIIFYDVNIYR